MPHPVVQIGGIQIRAPRQQDADDIPHMLGLRAEIEILKLVEDEILGRMDLDLAQRSAQVDPDAPRQG